MSSSRWRPSHRIATSIVDQTVECPMPLDASVQAKPLTATLHYLKRGSEKPVRYVFDAPPGVPQWNGIDDPHEIRIEDGRGREHEFLLDRNGFQLVKAPSQVRDFY